MRFIYYLFNYQAFTFTLVDIYAQHGEYIDTVCWIYIHITLDI